MNGRSHAPIQDVSPLIYASTKHLFVHRNQSMFYMMLLYRENFATDVTHVRVMKPLFRMQEADMKDSKDATHALQFPEQEEKPTHACTQDTSTKYSHWYGRYPWLAFIVGSPFLFFAFAVVNCFVFYLFLIIAEGRTVETNHKLPRSWFGLRQCAGHRKTTCQQSDYSTRSQRPEPTSARSIDHPA